MNDLPIAVKITEDGQIPLPEELRKELGLVPLQQVRLLKRGKELVIQQIAAELPLQERVETILSRSKVRAAALAGEVTTDEAWAMYDRAAATLARAFQENSPED